MSLMRWPSQRNECRSHERDRVLACTAQWQCANRGGGLKVHAPAKLSHEVHVDAAPPGPSVALHLSAGADVSLFRPQTPYPSSGGHLWFDAGNTAEWPMNCTR
eukprot:TRINITY_DN12099_c0_g1_i2.p2 TRINITY_DN12099_c0_g1~~TRINITY_DN12099_c0_g1_i2.p2  ORF type:complete len:103 (-),score=8.18 TRINITY_DN12099_c0_g1_i2:102-410(-)